MTKEQKLRNSREFRAVYDRGAQFRTPYFALFALKNEVGAERFGITVTRKLGCAVVRNRCRRQLRAIIEKHLLNSPASTGFDAVINVRSAFVGGEFKQIEDSFTRTLERVRQSLAG